MRGSHASSSFRRPRIVEATAVACLLFVATAGSLLAQGSAQHPIVDRFLAPDGQPLVSYRALRRLTATTRGGRMMASIEAWTSLDPVHGFSYEITNEEGSALIRHRVLEAALEAEQRAIASAETKGAALTPVNYEFLDVMPEADNLLRVSVKPRRKHVMLVDGSLLLNGESADLVRVEGELSQRPSFWTRRVRIVREYARIDGVHVPVAMHSTADVLIVGASTFAMTYRYAEINGIAVRQTSR